MRSFLCTSGRTTSEGFGDNCIMKYSTPDLFCRVTQSRSLHRAMAEQFLLAHNMQLAYANKCGMCLSALSAASSRLFHRGREPSLAEY
jgi:hypothetical protein